MAGRSRRSLTRRLLVTLLVTCTVILSSVSPALPPPVARAAFPSTVTWNGSAQWGPYWSTDFNWIPNNAPAFFADVVFDGTSVRDVLIDHDAAANSLTILNAYTGTFSANPGVLLEIASGLNMARASSFTLPVEVSATES